MTSPLFTRLGLAVTGLLSAVVLAGEDHDHSTCDHGHGEATDPFCFNLTDHWLDPWEHTHFRNGAPLIHNFGMEPAFLGREFFVDYVYSALEGGEEHELGAELEWALTRRIGVVLEQGYLFENPDSGAQTEGWGDFAMVPRFVLADCERCIISANLEIAAPTGSKAVGAGEEWHLAPFLNTWCDLGDWWSLTTQTGLEFALDSDETEFFFTVGLAKAVRVFEAPAGTDIAGHQHELPTGILSAIAELSGAAVVDGDPKDEGVFELNGLIGLSLSATGSIDLRAGYLFPLNAHSELEGGMIVGAIHRF